MPDVFYLTPRDSKNALRGTWGTHWHNEGDIKVYPDSHVQQLIKEAEERQLTKCAYQLFKFRHELENRVPAAVLVNLEQAILNAGGE